MKRKILFFTSTRADYGLLSSLIKLFYDDSRYDTKILITGTHLIKEFGNTVEEIATDGFSTSFQVSLPSTTDQSPLGPAKMCSEGLILFSQALLDFKPHLSVVLGDRFEALAFAFACSLNNMLLAHIHGGEITTGAIDDAFRHSITKMAHLHFASHDQYQKRIVQLGEAPETVHSVGALGAENAKLLKKMSLQELESNLAFQFKKSIVLVTYHPETRSHLSPLEQIEVMLSAVEQVLRKNSEVCFVFTMPNVDPGYISIRKKIQEFTKNDSSSCVAFESLGKLRYLSLLSHAKLMLGNSSSGILEAPALGVPVVNIGDRQAGRVRSDLIVDCPMEEKTIAEKIFEILTRAHHGTQNSNAIKTSELIKKTIDHLDFNLLSVKKGFHDLNQ